MDQSDDRTFEYKGHKGNVAFDDETNLFHGEVLDTNDVVTFCGKSLQELGEAFRESIDDCLEFLPNGSTSSSR